MNLRLVCQLFLLPTRLLCTADGPRIQEDQPRFQNTITFHIYFWLAPKTRSFKNEDANLQSFTENPKLRRRGASITKTPSFRASTEDAKLRRRGASELQPKTRSFRASKLQKRRRGASQLQELQKLQKLHSSTEDAELQSFKSFRSFKAKAKTRSFRASKLQNDSGTTLPMRSNFC